MGLLVQLVLDPLGLLVRFDHEYPFLLRHPFHLLIRFVQWHLLHQLHPLGLFALLHRLLPLLQLGLLFPLGLLVL